MKLFVLQENLQQVVQDLQRNIPHKPSLPILSCIYVTADESNTITFSATDLQIGIRSSIQGKVIEKGIAAIPAKIFIDYVSTLSAGEIEITLSGTSLTVQGKGSHAVIPCFSPTDYPVFPEKDGDEVLLPIELFTPLVQNTTFSSSADEARPILTSVLLALGEKTEVVATDGFRLSRLLLNFTHPTQQLLLPAKALNEVLRIAQRKKVESVSFYVSEKLKQVFFSFAEVEVIVRLMEGEFPPYQKIIPADFQTEVTFDGGELAQKMKTALIFARESSGIIRFQVKGEELHIISSSTTFGNQESTLPLRVLKGGDQEIAFNAKYVVDFLTVLKPETIWFGMNESLKPAVFRPEGMLDYEYVVMPFRVNQ